MKKNIHPAVQKTETTCSTCSSKYTFQTTKKSISADICAGCHPFFTGDRSIVKSTGQVDKFNKRYASLKK